jgi:hypothetical protein
MFRIILLLLLYPAVVSGQVEITWGIPQKAERKTEMTDLIGADEAYVYALRQDRSAFGSLNATSKVTSASITQSAFLTNASTEPH